VRAGMRVCMPNLVEDLRIKTGQSSCYTVRYDTHLSCRKLIKDSIDANKVEYNRSLQLTHFNINLITFNVKIAQKR
jgi:hypothetical protein